jgi:hypothetical protein
LRDFGALLRGRGCLDELPRRAELAVAVPLGFGALEDGLLGLAVGDVAFGGLGGLGAGQGVGDGALELLPYAGERAGQPGQQGEGLTAGAEEVLCGVDLLAEASVPVTAVCPRTFSTATLCGPNSRQVTPWLSSKPPSPSRQ